MEHFSLFVDAELGSKHETISRVHDLLTGIAVVGDALTVDEMNRVNDDGNHFFTDADRCNLIAMMAEVSRVSACMLSDHAEYLDEKQRASKPTGKDA